jgi:PBSX family phage terminase large subunit
MHYGPLSQKQKTAMLWWARPETEDYDAVICDGAIRSGKTLALTVGFVLWSMARFENQVFAMCGKTIESLRRNVVSLLPKWLAGEFQITDHRQENRITITRGDVTNSYYLFGGRDESSYMSIQGITLAGTLLDEVVLMPRSFVEQTMARCSVPGSRLFFSCNPETPGHWFYREWIQQAECRNALYLHFTLDDNMALDPEVKARYGRMYTGAFYRRYVLGQWCSLQGLVYPLEPESVTAETLPKEPVSYYISVDYGTRNPCSMGLWAVETRTGYALRLREYYYDSRSQGGQKTDEEYYEALCQLAGDTPVSQVVVDPSALSFLTVIRRHGRFSVKKANNDVISGIRTVGEYLKSGRVKIHPCCKDTLLEMQRYRWANEEGQDKPVKEQDHAMDDMRYFVMTILRRL